MKKWLEIALGIFTSIGGFLDAGALATALGAGALFGYSLLWAFVASTICVMFLVEMSGRLSACSGHTLIDGVRERFGFRFLLVPLLSELIVDILVLGAEMGGACIALQFLTGIPFQWFGLPVAFFIWIVMWKGNFSLIENGTAGLGLITLVFVVVAFMLHPPAGEIARGLIPALPKNHVPEYLFLAVAIFGAILSPYLFYFYSSGAVEDKWGQDDIMPNRVVSVLGMGFGSTVAISVLVVAAIVLHPLGITVDNYQQAGAVLVPVLGKWGFYLFCASVFIACMGAAFEVNLDTAYIVAQSFGWNWGESLPPKNDARFSFVYTVYIAIASLFVIAGLDPLKLTLFSMALTALVLPLVILPFIVLMNDEHYVGKNRNGLIGNTVVILVVGLAFVMALVAIPLEIVGG